MIAQICNEGVVNEIIDAVSEIEMKYVQGTTAPLIQVLRCCIKRRNSPPAVPLRFWDDGMADGFTWAAVLFAAV